MGYVAQKGYGGQSTETVEGIYLIATVVPLVMFALMLLLMILYPLGQKKDTEMRAKLAALRAEREADAEDVFPEGEGSGAEEDAETAVCGAESDASGERAPACEGAEGGECEKA